MDPRLHGHGLRRLAFSSCSHGAAAGVSSSLGASTQTSSRSSHTDAARGQNCNCRHGSFVDVRCCRYLESSLPNSPWRSSAPFLLRSPRLPPPLVLKRQARVYSLCLILDAQRPSGCPSPPSTLPSSSRFLCYYYYLHRVPIPLALCSPPPSLRLTPFVDYDSASLPAACFLRRASIRNLACWYVPKRWTPLAAADPELLRLLIYAMQAYANCSTTAHSNILCLSAA